jgi:hypothetical protein
MTNAAAGGKMGPQPPCAFFLGDFNVGKSLLINALLRRRAMGATREESHIFPTFISRTNDAEASFSALLNQEGDAVEKTHEEFLSLRRETTQPPLYRAVAVRLPKTPFLRLVLVDTAGTSSDTQESFEIKGLTRQDEALMVVVTDIEYWSSKHNLDFIAYHQRVFGSSLMVVANKADHLNASDIKRICERAAQRMERFGISPAPPFFALSARLEIARGPQPDEYRKRTKREVRMLCDSAFDAFRVALYEFEALHAADASCPTFDQLFASPLLKSFMEIQQGAVR